LRGHKQSLAPNLVTARQSRPSPPALPLL
jgi:hypothetical protein